MNDLPDKDNADVVFRFDESDKARVVLFQFIQHLIDKGLIKEHVSMWFEDENETELYFSVNDQWRRVLALRQLALELEDVAAQIDEALR